MRIKGGYFPMAYRQRAPPFLGASAVLNSPFAREQQTEAARDRA